MPCTTTIRLTLPHTPAQLGLQAVNESIGRDPKAILSALETLLHKVRSGAAFGAPCPVAGEWSALEVQVASTTAVRAGQTFTYAAAATAGKVCTINGVSFTAKAAAPLGVDGFLIGANAGESARNLAAAINASTTVGIAGVVFATAHGQPASATAKCVTCVATNNLVVGPVTFTAKAAVPTYTYVDENNATVLVGANDIAMSNNFAAAINLHPVTSRIVRAVADGVDTVLIAAKEEGPAGNLIPLTENAGTITLSNPTLVGGCDTVGQGRGPVDAVGVCTVLALQPGSYANAITTVTDDGGCAAGGATFANGAGEDSIPFFWRI